MAHPAIYQNIFHNLTDGVMALDFTGKIILFNPAAEALLGLAADKVLNREFAVVFMLEMEGNDDFNQAVLDAINREGMGKNSVVEFTPPSGDPKFFSVTSSFLHTSGEEESKGIIVVISDITQVKNLQHEQETLNSSLQQAWVEQERTTDDLRQALKRVRATRITAVCLFFFLALGAGIYTWKGEDLLGFVKSQTIVTQSADRSQTAVRTVPVSIKPLTSSISMSGKLVPLEIINIVCPYNAKIIDRRFEYGQKVNKGDILFTLDSTELEETLSEVEETFIQSRQKYEELTNWETSNEVIQIKRRVSKAKMALDKSKNKVTESQLLYDNGIVSANDLDNAREELANNEMSYKESREELDTVLNKGNAENLALARMKFENARAKRTRIRAKLSMSSVRAPVDGVVLKPIGGDTKDSKSIEKGASFQEGEVTVAVGNLEGMAVESRVDEVDVQNVRQGQDVAITGEGFLGVVLKGKIQSVSSIAENSAGNMDATMFPVRVVIPRVTGEQRTNIRLGMSANMRVETYNNPEALLVPIGAVTYIEEDRFVMVQDPVSGEIVSRPVVTGMTTLTEVEIRQGLSPEDMVVIP
ncbi:PAS domain S-box protein [Desulfoplanes sp. PS50]